MGLERVGNAPLDGLRGRIFEAERQEKHVA
jgi:hypothetical protein